MDSEGDISRPLAARSYEPNGLQLRVPFSALASTLTLLRKAGRRESGVLWYGVRDAAGNGTVAYVVAPRQRMSWGNYLVPAQALTDVVLRLPDPWKPLAQIHSHPGGHVEHSGYDDEMACSRKALSIVFPFYGRGAPAFPIDVGIHEWQNEYWHLLDQKSAKARVVLVPGEVKVEDLR